MTDDSDSIRQAEEFKEQGNAFLQKAHDFKSAIAAYTSAINLVSSNYIYFNNRAAAYTFAGEYQNAINDCDTSLSLKESVRAYSRKAAALCELGNLDAATEAIEKGLRLSPDDKQSLNIQTGLSEMKSQAEIFKQEGNRQVQETQDYKKAVEAYTAAIAIVKTNYIYYNNRAAAYIFAGEYEQAIADCDISLGIKENVRAMSRKATALGELGDLNGASTIIEKALLLSPDDKPSLNIRSGLQVMKSQAETFKDQGRKQLKTTQDVKSAIKAFSSAIALTKCNHLYYNNRAAAYVFAGEYEKAIRDSDKSLSIKENVRAYAWKSQALGELNRMDDAIISVEKGLELDPMDKMCQEIEAQLLKKKVYLDDLQEQDGHGEEESHKGDGHGGRKTLMQGIKQFGQKVKKMIPLDYPQRCAQEDDNLIQRQSHARKFRIKLKEVREEKYYFYLYTEEDESLRLLLEKTRQSRKERKIEFLYQKRISAEDTNLLTDLITARQQKELRYLARIEADDKALLSSQEHARDLTKWKRIKNDLAEKARLRKAEKDAKRDSAKWIKETIARKRKEAGLDDIKPRVPEHMLPFEEKIDLWRHQIRKKLKKDWGNMTFSIEYIEEEGLCIGFDIEDCYAMAEDNLDFKIARYMNKLAINGILHDKKLHKRADKWRVLEDGQDGRIMSLRFYCHIPRTNEAHLKMPRTTDIDIIEREQGLYDYDLLPREKIVKTIARSAYLRENRPPMLSHGKTKLPKKRGVADRKEYVTLPSVEVETSSPGFVHLRERDNEVWGGKGDGSGGSAAKTKAKSKSKTKRKKPIGKGGDGKKAMMSKSVELLQW